MHAPKSLLSLFLCWALLFSALFFYFPRWKNYYAESTIGWDVTGYYYYLPALFIYKDIKQLHFKDQILQQYRPTNDFQQAFLYKNGHYVMKYSLGQAVLYSPYFFIAHAWASSSGTFPADGFSYPYQFMIALGSLLTAFLGLLVLRRVLLRFFSDGAVAVTLILLVFASNYLEYASITGAMTHNYLFTLYALLLAMTIRFYDKPSYLKASAIGLIVGLSALVRPTEIISVLIPLLWGFKLPLREGLTEKIQFVKDHLKYLLVAAVAVALVGSLQLIYWKYVSGNWFVYSYQEEGFSWLRPHLWNCMFSYKAGWLVYTPIMLFALIGFNDLAKQHRQLFLGLLAFSLLFIYIAFAWDIWWYGGSLGQRAMVQAYSVLAFPLAAFVEATLKTRFWKYLFAVMALICIYLNLWWSHQAHRGGLFIPEQINRAYFWNVLGRYKQVDTTMLKLLDTNEPGFSGKRKNVRQLVLENFERDTSTAICDLPPIQGQRSACVNANRENLKAYSKAIKNGDAQWFRASATFRCRQKEVNIWSSPQLVLMFYNSGEILKGEQIRVYRFLNDGETKTLFFDIKAPKATFDRVGVSVWNGGGVQPLLIDNLKLEAFDAQ